MSGPARIRAAGLVPLIWGNVITIQIRKGGTLIYTLKTHRAEEWTQLPVEVGTRVKVRSPGKWHNHVAEVYPAQSDAAIPAGLYFQAPNPEDDVYLSFQEMAEGRVGIIAELVTVPDTTTNPDAPSRKVDPIAKEIFVEIAWRYIRWPLAIVAIAVIAFLW
mgnify:FL=1